MRPASLLCSCAVWLAAAGLSSTPAHAQGYGKPIQPGVVMTLDEKVAALKAPTAVALDVKTGEFYVADPEGGAVFLFDENGREKAKWSIPAPHSIGTDARGRLYVCDTKGAITTYNFRGEKEGVIELTGLPEGAGKPAATQVVVGDDGDLYIADGTNQAVLVVAPDGKFVRAYGDIAGKGRGAKFKGLQAFCIGRNRLYAIDRATCKISVFGRRSSEFLFSFGEMGGTPGKLGAPVSLAVDAEGRIYVLDTVRHCISIFDEEGKWLAECGGQGSSPGWFNYPNTINRDGKGRFYVCEAQQKRVQVFTISLEPQNGAKDK